MSILQFQFLSLLIVSTHAIHVLDERGCFGLVMTDIRAIVRDAIAEGNHALVRLKELNQYMSALGIDEPTQSRSMSRKTYNQHYAAFIQNMPEETALIGESGFVTQYAIKYLVRRLRVTFNDLITCKGLVRYWRDSIDTSCTRFRATCNPRNRYRTYDGTCNNLNNPLWGRSNKSYKRYLESVYEDDIGEPRLKSVVGNDLPSPRTVSNVVHRQDPCCPLVERSLSQLVQQWGQLIDHDFTDTAIAKGVNETTIQCCKIPAALRNLRSECFPIKILPGDLRFPNKTCMNFVRAVPSHADNCDIDRRQQLNMATSFVDASFLYGHTVQDAESLRSFRDGKLTMTKRGVFPPRDGDNRNCMVEHPRDYCMKAGDSRLHVVPGLTAVLIICLREHNRIADILQQLNPSWDDELLYQEARKIVIAEVQHITFGEWLPLILGGNIYRKFNLQPRRSGYRTMYDPNVNPTVANIFGVAAFRFGHSMLDDTMLYTEGQGTHFRFEELFNRPTLILNRYGTSYVGQGLALQASGKADGIAVESVRDNLFIDEEGNSFDLFSLNIQRGRDHGVPGYNAWRRFCGLPYAIHFQGGRGGLVDHTPENARKLRYVYRHPEDIDVFSGGISEIPVRGGAVGPLFACIIGLQFAELKRGDRFFYEYAHRYIGFTNNQLNSIKRMSMSKLMCLHLQIQRVQIDPFLLPSKSNKMVDCGEIPDINFLHWKI